MCTGVARDAHVSSVLLLSAHACGQLQLGLMQLQLQLQTMQVQPQQTVHRSALTDPAAKVCQVAQWICAAWKSILFGGSTYTAT